MFQAVYLLAGQASSRWKIGDVLCGNAPQDRHQVRDSCIPTVSQELCHTSTKKTTGFVRGYVVYGGKVRLNRNTKSPAEAEKSANIIKKSDRALLNVCSAAVQQTDFKYLYYLKNVYFLLVMSTETEHSMRPLVSLDLFKKTFLKGGRAQRTKQAFNHH